jgi:uncharacterized membrane protein
MVNLNYTPIFDAISDEVHVNTSYHIANQPPLMTAQWVWLIFAICGVLLLIYSVKHHEDMEGDLCGILAAIVCLISALQSFAVDTVTGYGVTGLCEILSADGICTKETWVLIESHQIYHYDLWGYVLGIIFIICIANLFLLWLRHTRITNQTSDQIDHRALSAKVGTEDQSPNNKNNKPDKTN